MSRRTRGAERTTGNRFDALRVKSTSVRFNALETIYAQGDACAAVMYIHEGNVRLTVTSQRGREAVVGLLKAGEFFGEGALAGQRRRKATAKTTTGSMIGFVSLPEMRRRLREGSALSDWFRSHLLTRNNQIEADLVAHIFNRSEKRLARALLLLARVNEHDAPRYPLPAISRDLLAQMAGITRSRVDVLMNKFRKLGFLERHRGPNGGLYAHCSLLTVVLED